MNLNLYRDFAVPVRARRIDMVEALDLLDSCVRDYGEGFRSQRRHDALPTATDSIVTLALSKAGAPLTALSPLAHTPIADLYASGRPPLPLTLGAVVVFRAAESEDRRGQTWAMCSQAALRAASRFVELIPDRVVRCAAEAVAATDRGAPLAQHGEGGCAGRGSGA
jgi:hypothetical protein